MFIGEIEGGERKGKADNELRKNMDLSRMERSKAAFGGISSITTIIPSSLHN